MNGVPARADSEGQESFVSIDILDEAMDALEIADVLLQNSVVTGYGSNVRVLLVTGEAGEQEVNTKFDASRVVWDSSIADSGERVLTRQDLFGSLVHFASPRRLVNELLFVVHFSLFRHHLE